MKLRLTHKSSLAVLAIVVTLCLDSIIRPTNAYLKLYPILLSLAYFASLIPQIAKAYFSGYWTMSVTTEYGQELPMRVIDCKQDNGLVITETKVYIAGVESEVTKDSEPYMFGITRTFCDHVVHIEDLLLDDDDLLDLVNETYGTDYFIEEK